MFWKRIILLVCMSFMLAGCMSNDEDFSLGPTTDDDLELTKLSSYGIYDQNPANSAKQMLSTHENLKQIRAVNDDSMVVIAVDVEQEDRFLLDEIEKELRSKMNEYFSDMTVALSTDQKILLELERLEKRLETEKMSNEQLKSQLKKIKKLSKEQT